MTPRPGARLAVLLLASLVLTACASSAAGPVAIEPGRDACASCRMTFASAATAVEIVRPLEEPVLFDDLACFRQYIATTPVPADATVWVADHLTGAWIEGGRAVITASRAATPMGSGLVAHESTANRDRDPAARGGTAVAWETLRP